jgi:uncharacterized membrane protein YfcA
MQKHEDHIATPVMAGEQRIRRRRNGAMHWKRVASVYIIIFGLLLVGYALLDNPGIPYSKSVGDWVRTYIDKQFLLFVLSGFLAQMADGMLSLGYGAINSMILLGLGMPPAAVSGSIHTAEIFSTGMSGYSHYRFGNVNRKMFAVMLVPGVLGAIAGAVLLVWLGQHYASAVKPLLAIYCAILGARILLRAFQQKQKKRKVKRIGWLAGAGGFLDSFGGGGWGPLVTSTLISKGRTPRYVIGSVSLVEFFVTLASAFSFFIFLGITHLSIILGLIAGGLLATPIATRLAGKIPARPMMIIVGALVILWSLRVALG